VHKVIPMQLSADRTSSPGRTLASTVIQSLGPSADFFLRDPGEILFSIGQKPSNVLILLQGNVKLSMDSEDGRSHIFRIAGPEEILGLSSVVAVEPYDKNSTTLTLCRFASVTICDFDCLLRCSAQNLILALSELNNSYKHACTQIQILGQPSISVRLARAILQWSLDGQKTDRGLRFHIPLNHNRNW
jgi:CRP/FNR family transcriptional regulator, cyclic AMP receptor protein